MVSNSLKTIKNINNLFNINTHTQYDNHLHSFHMNMKEKKNTATM